MKILRVKWEKILLLVYGTFYIIKLSLHINKYGFDFESDVAMLLIFSILLLSVYIATLSLRKDLLKERNDKNERKI